MGESYQVQPIVQRYVGLLISSQSLNMHSDCISHVVIFCSGSVIGKKIELRRQKAISYHCKQNILSTWSLQFCHTAGIHWDCQQMSSAWTFCALPESTWILQFTSISIISLFTHTRVSCSSSLVKLLNV